jgi:ribonucleoside-diphosphate reductase alpha chain
MAWKKGIKSLYYCRSKSLQRAEVVSFPKDKGERKPTAVAQSAAAAEPKYEECIACQ